jgi:uncharacterized protein (TIGR02145 family)
MSASLYSQQKTASEIIYEAIYNEEITGQLDKADELLNKVLKDFPTNRGDCAQALYHLGLVAEKRAKGQDGKKAESYYVRVIEKYPDAGEYTELARNRLSKLRENNTFTDPRDGHKYRWVKIGSQIWMAENLAYMPHVNPPKKQEDGIWVYDYEGEDVAEAKATENYQKYGCLYDWAMAMNIDTKYLEEPWNGNSEMHQGICPPGWHLPTDGEWKVMEKSLGMPDSLLDRCCDTRAGEDTWAGKNFPPVGKYLKSSSGWKSGGVGDNSSGFFADPAGQRLNLVKIRFDSNFEYLGASTDFWTASPSNPVQDPKSNEIEFTAYHRSLFFKGFDVYRDQYANRADGLSVRCVKDDPASPFITNINSKSGYQKPAGKTNVSEDLMSEKSVTPVLMKKFSSPGLVLNCLFQDNLIFISWSKSKIVYALDSNTLDTVWKYDSKDVLQPRFKLSGNMLICINRKQLFALNTLNGGLIWERKWGGETGSVTAKDVFYTSIGNSFIAINLATGEDIWSHTEEGYGFGNPVYADGIVYWPLININKEYIDPSNQVETKHPILVALNATTGERLWDFKSFGQPLLDCYYSNGLIYIQPNSIAQGNYCYAINAKDGQKEWRVYLEKAAESRAVSDGSIYILVGLNGGRTAYSLNADGSLNWKKCLSDNSYSSQLAPVVYDNKIFLRTLNKSTKKWSLSALDTETGSKKVIYNLPVEPNWLSPQFFNNKMYVAGKDSGLYVFDYPKID